MLAVRAEIRGEERGAAVTQRRIVDGIAHRIQRMQIMHHAGPSPSQAISRLPSAVRATLWKRPALPSSGQRLLRNNASLSQIPEQARLPAADKKAMAVRGNRRAHAAGIHRGGERRGEAFSGDIPAMNPPVFIYGDDPFPSGR